MKQGENMTSRERVLAVTQGKSVDRIPVFYWLNPHGGIKMMSNVRKARRFTTQLKGQAQWKLFRKGGGPLIPESLGRGLPLLFEGTLNREYVRDLGSDTALVETWYKPVEGKTKYKIRKNDVIVKNNAFGEDYAMGSGIYMDVTDNPIKTAEDLVKYRFPDSFDPSIYAPLSAARKKDPEAFLMGTVFGSQDYPGASLAPMTEWMMWFYDCPDKVADFQKRMADWSIEVARRCIRAGADAVFIYDDYGFDNQTFLPPDLWRETTYIHLKRIIDAIHEEGALAVLHSCGYQMPLLGDYVEAGLDMLQAFQPKAGNDFKEAYGKYGKDLTFITGIDVQQGESMSPEELREDILRFYRIGGEKGHHILGMSHMMQHTMPVENMQTMLKTVEEIQSGVHK
ncbi:MULTISPECIES: uroporphyrinogen decarboxylase family protein [unclassified Oceanispirochaeta]|uniref:uroporphyrinogen decarboxylase family protein n=1 Tax=unclassified Oceanispirochaeta TaxID=2635722 RepID=UPI000E0981E2|nr:MULTISPECIES: uroporphyrinogen decarboxylase family protein [unclassified Oceanispirochaeta]MBF9018701.1 hypothetical protein [Oceanispirochaeta sp. M2]NPD75124.1 hypothetical protein [Oceanispirochaeta sp. M1]RDG29011.1 hypothetical protein DV872_23795 [Oceanispirochaeta sp. M1]